MRRDRAAEYFTSLDYIGRLDPLRMEFPSPPLERQIEDVLEDWLRANFPRGEVRRQFSGWPRLRPDLIFETKMHRIIIEIKRDVASWRTVGQLWRYLLAGKDEERFTYGILAAPRFNLPDYEPDRYPWLGILPLRISWPDPEYDFI